MHVSREELGKFLRIAAENRRPRSVEYFSWKWKLTNGAAYSDPGTIAQQVLKRVSRKVKKCEPIKVTVKRVIEQIWEGYFVLQKWNSFFEG